ncbi:MAG: ABC transporter permease [Clostridiaceae bacterium]|nr:ABC transporter permease [Clostridiaceae bacterium]
MRNLLLLILNNLKVTFRKKGNIVVYVFLPLTGVLISMLMYGDTSVAKLDIGFADHDGKVLAAELKEEFGTVEGFTISDVREEEISDKLLSFELDAVVVVPENYTDSIYSGNAADIEIFSLKGQETTVWIEQVINTYTSSMLRLSDASGGDQAAFDRMLGQVKEGTIELKLETVEDRAIGKSMTVTSVGFLILFLMLGTGFTSGIILNEKRTRTYHRICSAPVSARQYILANSITSLLISIVQIVFLLAVMRFVIRIDTGVNDLYMFFILLIFATVSIGLSLVITAFTSSSYMAGTLSTLIITPTCMLGGCYWDVNFMPEFMQKIGFFVPQRWVIDAITKMQTGSDIGDINLNLLVLAAFALTLTLAAVYKFSRTSNVRKFI